MGVAKTAFYDKPQNMLLAFFKLENSLIPLTEKQLVAVIDAAIVRFKGDSRPLSNAIGYLMMGRQFGWKVMLLMHDRKSIKEYERILEIDSKAIFDEFGPLADKSMAYRALKKVTNFWKAVKGEIPGVRSNEIRH